LKIKVYSNIDLNTLKFFSKLFYVFNTIRTEGKYEIFVNKIKNNFYGFAFFKNCHIFYQNW
jgi:hypothetical protein